MQHERLTSEDMVALLLDCGIAEGDRIAIAVSGGADSMCLAFLLAGRPCTVALTVDHALRPESAAEAEWVAEQSKRLGLEHHILTWTPTTKPEGNIQALAREARYALLSKWCEQNEVRFLLTAHHLDDQAETVLLRLARGSGVHGLASMAKSRHLSKSLSLVRPFLSHAKTSLIATLEANGQTWVEDPSNRSESFERVKARKLLASKPLEGLDARKLSETAARLRLTREAIDFYERHWLSTSVQFFESGYALLDKSKLEAAPREVVLRGLTSLLRFASGSRYGARFEKLERLRTALTSETFKGQTLNGVQFAAPDNETVIVARELAAVEKKATLPVPSVWDERYDVKFESTFEGFEIRPLGETGFNHLRKVLDSEEFTRVIGKIPRVAALVLPAFFQQDRLIAVPHLKYSKLSAALPKLSHRWLTLNSLDKKKT